MEPGVFGGYWLAANRSGLPVTERDFLGSQDHPHGADRGQATIASASARCNGSAWPGMPSRRPPSPSEHAMLGVPGSAFRAPCPVRNIPMRSPFVTIAGQARSHGSCPGIRSKLYRCLDGQTAESASLFPFATLPYSPPDPPRSPKPPHQNRDVGVFPRSRGPSGPRVMLRLLLLLDPRARLRAPGCGGATDRRGTSVIGSRIITSPAGCDGRTRPRDPGTTAPRRARP